MVSKGTRILHLFHYLDDYITMGVAGSERCKRTGNMMTLITTCSSLGVLIAPDKCKGLATNFT